MTRLQTLCLGAAAERSGDRARPTGPARRLRMNHVAAAVALAIAAPGILYGQEAVQEVTVTGSRIISKTGMDTPTPVTAVSASEIAQMSRGTLVDALSQLPQFSGNITQQTIIGGQNSGGANVNLRGAGVNRTLVLLDGRRVVSSNRFGTVDVNMFPDPLLKGVDVVTGGASATYGTDAVAGVVNFLLDTHFTGLKAHVQGAQTSRSDGKNWEASLAFGHGFGDRLHVVGSFVAYDEDPINSFSSLQDRRYFNQSARVTNPDPNGPAEIIRPYVAPTNFTNTGIIVDPPTAALPGLAALNRLVFNPDGTTSPFPFSGVGSLNTGCQCAAFPTQTYGVDADTEVQSGYRRANAFVHADYDFTDHVNVYLQGIHGDTRNNSRRESISLLSVWQARIFADNPYLPASVVQTMQANLPANRQFFGFGFFGLDSPDTPLGDSRQITDNHMDSATLGFKADVGRGWKLDGYYQYGENRQDFITQNGIRVDRLPLALDAVRDANGNIVCRVSLPQFDPAGIFKNCAPVNLFGGLQNLTPQAVAWIRDNGKIARQWTDQQVAEVVLTGDLWKGFGAGAIAGAFGASYRKDRLDQRTLDPSDEFPALPDGTLLSSLGIAPVGVRGVVPQGNTSIPGYTGIPGLRFVPAGFLGDSSSSSVLFSSLRTIAGDYNVKEAFSEFNIPLLKDLAWSQKLDLSAAGRWASYSGSGSIYAWKAGVNWALNDQIRFRGTQSRDVRAATLQERFDQTRGGVNVTDPANGNVVVTTASFSGGNPNVTPEKADTTTFGVVFRPSFLEGLSTSIDWYRIDINDAIGQLTSQNVVTGCFRGDVSLCQYVHRAGDLPNGTIERVDNLFINLASQRISGIDLETTYQHSLSLFGGGRESVAWRFYGTYLKENSIQNKGAARDERAGQVGLGVTGAGALPKRKFTTNVTYRNGSFSAFVQGRWIGGGLLDRLVVESQTAKSVLINGVNVPTISDNSVPSTFYADLNLNYTALSEQNLDLYLNVTNVFDRAPVLAPSIIGRAGTTEFNTAVHDVVGRRYALGFNYRF